LPSDPSHLSQKTRRTFVAIGLGSNIGDSPRTLAGAVERLAEVLDDVRVSPLYRTAPVGGPRQRDYLNAVVTGTTALAPLPLLALLQRLEREAGRRPSPVRDAPRPLDLDLLIYGNARIATPRLTVPHPRLGGRRFVLRPLADLAPSRVVPGLRRRVRTLLALAPDARVRRLGSAGWHRSVPRVPVEQLPPGERQ